MNLQEDLIDVFDNITQFLDYESLSNLACVSKTCNELAKKELKRRPAPILKDSNLGMVLALIHVEEYIDNDSNWTEETEVEMCGLTTFFTECKEKCTQYYFDINKLCEEYGSKIIEMAKGMGVKV